MKMNTVKYCDDEILEVLFFWSKVIYCHVYFSREHTHTLRHGYGQG